MRVRRLVNLSLSILILAIHRSVFGHAAVLPTRFHNLIVHVSLKETSLAQFRSALIFRGVIQRKVLALRNAHVIVVCRLYIAPNLYLALSCLTNVKTTAIEKLVSWPTHACIF